MSADIEEMPLTDLSDWLNKTLDTESGAIKISGGFRQAPITELGIDLFELNTRAADTVRVLIPKDAPKPSSGKPKSTEFSQRDQNWWECWAAFFSATSLLPPIVDPKRLSDILHEKRRLRFCCDTNALCNGVATWLLTILNGKADIVTSAVVDRELAAWPDRFKKMWQPQTTEDLKRRTHFRMARRLTENPPGGVVVDRLSPEQGALMLAKLRDETDRKSPDADMLLVELARGLIRDQPRNARIIYLTGDRNHARAATNALGSDNVLFSVSDASEAKKKQGKVLARGWWHPEGPLGSIVVPPLHRLLWDLLTICDYIVITSQSGKWHLRVAHSVALGVPSDWADPWIKIETLSQPATKKSSDIESPTSLKEIEETDSTDGYLGSQIEVVQPEENSSESAASSDSIIEPSFIETLKAIDLSDVWLLPPISPSAPLEGIQQARPTPRIFFSHLWQLISGSELPDPITTSPELYEEVRKILIWLGAMNEDGTPGSQLDLFSSAWMENDLDWFHSQMCRLPIYATVIDKIRVNDATFTKRQEVCQSMARILGQVARVSSRTGPIMVGDAPLRASDLRGKLDIWLPNVNDTLEVADICQRALLELQVTPARLEIAMNRFWATDPSAPFEGRTGGTVTGGSVEKVIRMNTYGYEFIDITSAALTFGRNGFVRFIERVP